jgi:twinkle protein
VARLFDYNRLWQIKFSNRKDANEYLQHGEDNELREIFRNSKRYLPDNIISTREEFFKVLQEEPKWGVPYPFPTLTEMTYGIRKGETVLLTAQEGVGKTELMHAIEYQILKETDENVGAIFLEEPPRRHLQALAGLHLKRPVHLPDSGVTSAEVIRAVGEIVPVDDRLHVYRHFGSDDPEQFLDTVRFLAAARSCGYVLVDHLTMVCSGMAEDDERRKLDYLSTKLEMMVMELNYALIIVSHVNDFGQTRGSRAIGKLANTRIDAFRELASNTTHLTISKNRFGAKTGAAGTLQFDPLTWTYSEERLCSTSS